MPLFHLIVLIANGHHYLLASADLAFSLALEGVPKLNRARINLTERRAKNRITFYNPVHLTKAPATRGVTIPTSWFEALIHRRVLDPLLDGGYAGTLRMRVIKTSFSEIASEGARSGNAHLTATGRTGNNPQHRHRSSTWRVRTNLPSRCNLLFTILTEQAPEAEARGANFIFPG